jgi:hypothetical protein
MEVETMERFKLLNDQEVTVSVRLLHRKPIREAVGVDIVAAAHDPDQLKQLLDLLTDPDKLWTVVSVVSGVSVDDLLAQADGSTEEDAGTALLESVVSFFPKSSPLRTPLLRLLERTKETHGEQVRNAEQLALEAVESLDIGSVISDANQQTNG